LTELTEFSNPPNSVNPDNSVNLLNGDKGYVKHISLLSQLSYVPQILRTAGFEPATCALESNVVSQAFAVKMVAERGIEPRSNDYQSFALPIKLHR
jgi:hypothetical protein